MGLLNKKNINRINRLKTSGSFKKKDLEFGTVVMFGDKTFGMFIPEKFRTKYLQSIKEDKGDSFVCYAIADARNYDTSPCYFDLDLFDDNLRYIKGGSTADYDVIRVYKEKVDPIILNQVFINHFAFCIQEWIKNKEYIER